MKVYIGADHRGFRLKEELKSWFAKEYEVIDVGAFTLDPQDDYVSYAEKVAEEVVVDMQNSRGIIICGSGVGVDVAANKIEGIRCGLGFSQDEIRAARNDDDINVLALPANFVDSDFAKKIVKIFLETPFGKTERFERRINEISEIEESQE